MGILDNAGNWVVEYTYDAWGAPTSLTGSMANTLGVINPFRYRGYVYDQETGLYYLRSRYYNPVICRFICPDIVIGKMTRFLAHNLFSYTRNKVVLRLDKSGKEDEKCSQCGQASTLYMSVTMSFDEFDSYIDVIKQKYPVKEMESLAEDVGIGVVEDGADAVASSWLSDAWKAICDGACWVWDKFTAVIGHSSKNGSEYTSHLLDLYHEYDDNLSSVNIIVFGNRREGRKYVMTLSLTGGEQVVINRDATSIWDKMDPEVMYTIVSVLKNDFGGLNGHIHPDPNISFTDFMNSLN